MLELVYLVIPRK